MPYNRKGRRCLERLEKGQYDCVKMWSTHFKRKAGSDTFTTMCVKCRQEEWEDGPSYNLKARRSVEEGVIMPPFGGENNDTFDNKLGQGSDLNMFDGEDAWQAVARYGTSESPSDIGSVLDYDNVYYDYDEDVGITERYEQIPVYKDQDGQFYQDFQGLDDEDMPPAENDKD